MNLLKNDLMYTEGGPGNNFEMGKLTEVDLKI
jgi:hypothetical protein